MMDRGQGWRIISQREPLSAIFNAGDGGSVAIWFISKMMPPSVYCASYADKGG